MFYISFLPVFLSGFVSSKLYLRLDPQMTPFSLSSTDLKKAFHTPPFSDRVEVDQTVELRCVPPDGNPTPQLSWTKNGVPVDPKQDPNYIISNEGNLLIAAAKLSDMANYSCVAENVATRRVSTPARLTVYGTYWCPETPGCSGSEIVVPKRLVA